MTEGGREQPVDPSADPRDYALPARRRGELLRIAKERGSITVAEIAAQFAVSADTIRRDLEYLQGRGLLTRTHGGAVPVDGLLVDRDAPVALRRNAHVSEKTRIAHAAVDLIANGETLVINGGTTTRAFVGELGARRNLTIVTNNLDIPASVPANSTRAIYLLGGLVRSGLQVTMGAVGFAEAGPISADTAVIGVGGISQSGVSTTMIEEATMMRAMMNSARRVIVVADSSKFGVSVFAHIAPLDHVHVLVTDSPPPALLAQALAEAGVDVMLAD